MDEEFKTYKKDAIKAAKDLRYGWAVVDKIKSAKSETERHKRLD